jgi:DNA-binding NarL/FixJ family response regulator
MSQQVLADTVRVAIYAPDSLTRAGLISLLANDRRLVHVPVAKRDADVTVVATDIVDAATLGLLRRLGGDDRDGEEPCFVLMVGKRWDADVSEAVGCGVRAVLWRDTFTQTDWARTLLTFARGRSSSPTSSHRLPMPRARETQRDVLVPRGLREPGITSRETDILRLVADGEQLSDIAARLCYSERTVKYVLHGMIKRLDLRNRAHAVSYAIRCGLI